MAKNELPNLLSFTRSIVPSNGVFYYLKDGKKCPILITEQTVRGTISNYGNVYKNGKQEDQANVEKELDPENANIQTIDICYLPPDIDSYHLNFSISFINKSLSPNTCNNLDFAQKIETLTKDYAEKGGYLFLAKAYLTNIINGRWLWRNRYASDKQITLTIAGTTEPLIFAVQDYNKLQLDNQQQKAFDNIAQKIAHAFTGASEPFRLNVSATGKIGNGQEVYPSQEFIQDKDKKEDNEDKEVKKSKKGKKNKFLAYNQTEQGKQALMHSQKIGNAIRTIDRWYPDYKNEKNEPLAIEPYGVMQQRAKAFRLPNTKTDLYTYLQNLEELQNATELDNRHHYLIACLIRGGVYSGEKKDKKGASKK